MTEEQTNKVIELLFKKSYRHSQKLIECCNFIGNVEINNIAETEQVSKYDVIRIALDVGIWPTRYMRNRAFLTLEEQARLHHSCIFMIGLGATGGNTVNCLARLGVGNIVLCDGDTFDESNLNRQPFCDEESIGQSKAIITHNKLKKINSYINTLGVPEHFSENLNEMYMKYFRLSNIIVEATDNTTIGLSIENICNEYDKPLIHGSSRDRNGTVMFCKRDLNSISKLYNDKPCNDYPFNSVNMQQYFGGTSVICPTVIGALQAYYTVSYLLNRPFHQNNYYNNLTEFLKFDLPNQTLSRHYV